MATLKKTPAPVAAAKKVAVPAKAAPAARTPPVRRAATAAKKPVAGARTAPVKPVWMAPADFKPSFFDFSFKTDAYGLIESGSLTGERVKGRWDNEDAKRFDMADYDQATLAAFGMRMSPGIFAPNPERRVPGDKIFRMIVRVSKKAADGSLSARIVGVSMKSEGKKAKWFEDKSDITYRKIRKAARILPSAFINVQLPPSGRRSSKKDSDEE